MAKRDLATNARTPLPKAATGIRGLDEITGGGLPKGRPTLIAGAAGCGKTLFGIQFLVSGIREHGEPGVLMAFEETAQELAENVRSLGVDLQSLIAAKRLVIDYVRVDRSEIEESGSYDLEGLFVRLGHAIDTVGAKRVMLDTIEALFASFSDSSILRAELRRLFRWLKSKGVTAVITAERGERGLTRHGIEEYVSDCVLLLDHRVSEQVSTRRMRVMKYRGSAHGTNEYPFLIDKDGIWVLPITSMGLDYSASSERVDTGIPELTEMLQGGYYRGSSILVSGTAGTGKTTVAVHFIDAACRRGEPCLYVAFEESQQQIARNARSVGIDLERWIKQGRLRVQAARPTECGLEMHVATLLRVVESFRPRVVVIDPVTNLFAVGALKDINAALTRVLDFLKHKGVTALLTSLSGNADPERTDVAISSLTDTWVLLRNLESNGERNRALYVLKSRGMAHSNQVREFVMTDMGVRLVNAYIGPDGVLTGTARVAQEAKDRDALRARQAARQRVQRELVHKKAELDAQIASLRAQFAHVEARLREQIEESSESESASSATRERLAKLRRRGLGEIFKSVPASARTRKSNGAKIQE